MEIIQLGPLSMRDWIGLTGREPEAFGAHSAGLAWRPKERHVGLRDDAGRLAAAGGVTVASVRVGGAEAFDVVGFGGLIIRADLRGSRLMTPVMDALVRLGDTLGPDRAMIFCDASLIPLYTRRGYRPIDAEVWVDQPEGRIAMPLPALWRAVRPGCPAWPAGRVDVAGLPF